MLKSNYYICFNALLTLILSSFGAISGSKSIRDNDLSSDYEQKKNQVKHSWFIV